MTSPVLPPPLQRLRETLESAGFWLAEEERRDEGFGDMFLVLMKRGICVRFVSDRAQWFVEISGQGCDEWFSPMVWRAYMDGNVGDVAIPPLDDQCRIIESRLREIESAFAEDAELTQHLLSLRAERARMRRDDGASA